MYLYVFIVYLNVFIVNLKAFECTCSISIVYFNVLIIYSNAFIGCFNVFQCISMCLNVFINCCWISNSCTWPSALLGHLFPSPNWPLWKFYPPKFPATLALKTMTARRSPLYFRTVGGQENHVQSALLIESSVVWE
jgi:hypothetical protein